MSYRDWVLDDPGPLDLEGFRDAGRLWREQREREVLEKVFGPTIAAEMMLDLPTVDREALRFCCMKLNDVYRPEPLSPWLSGPADVHYVDWVRELQAEYRRSYPQYP